MGDTTMEQKLQLLRQVRSRYEEDQYDMSNRERILYGRTSITPEKMGGASLYGDSYREGLPEGQMPSSFRLRLFLAIFLVMTVIVMDKNDMTLAGITPEKIYEVISADYEEAIEAWVEQFSQR